MGGGGGGGGRIMDSCSSISVLEDFNETATYVTYLRNSLCPGTKIIGITIV